MPRSCRRSLSRAFAILATLAPPSIALAAEPPPPEPPLPPCSSCAAAQRAPLQVAVDPGAPPPFPPPPPAVVAVDGPPPSHARGAVDAGGPRITLGRAFTNGIADGWYGRVDAEWFEVGHRDIIGLQFGLEGWGCADGGGAGIPWTFELGASLPFADGPRSPRALILGGLGWEWAFYDRIRGHGQFGILSPMASALIGLDLRGVRILGELSAQYRWGWGDLDRSQIRAGMAFSFDSELWDESDRGAR